MADLRDGEPDLLFPGLAGFYAAVSDLWYPMIRITGACLLVFGWEKIHAGLGPITVEMVRMGFAPTAAFAAVDIFLETFAAACIMLCLFTHFFAPATAIMMALIVSSS